MQTANALAILIDGILWMILFVIRAIAIGSTSLSHFELQRRVMAGDMHAKKISDREKLVPRLNSLQWLISTIIWLTAVFMLLHQVGWLWGFVGVFILSILQYSFARSKVIKRLTHKFYQKVEPSLLSHVSSWRFLDLFGPANTLATKRMIGSKAELDEIIMHSDIVDARERRMIQAALSFSDLRVSDIMTPINAVTMVKASDILGPVFFDTLHQTGHHEFPVMEGTKNNIVGIFDVDEAIERRSSAKQVRDAMDPRIGQVDKMMPVDQLTQQFDSARERLLIVVEDGSTVGIVTLGDFLKALAVYQ